MALSVLGKAAKCTPGVLGVGRLIAAVGVVVLLAEGSRSREKGWGQPLRTLREWRKDSVSLPWNSRRESAVCWHAGAAGASVQPAGCTLCVPQVQPEYLLPV